MSTPSSNVDLPHAARYNTGHAGGMAERLNAAVLKTVVSQDTAGSNPAPTAIGAAAYVISRAVSRPLWRDAGVAEQGSLLSCCGSISRRGFESLSLRHTKNELVPKRQSEMIRQTRHSDHMQWRHHWHWCHT